MDNTPNYLPTKKVLERYGITAMTLWRWLRDPVHPFPAPMVIHRRNYFEAPQIEAWERARAAASALPKPKTAPTADAA